MAARIRTVRHGLRVVAGTRTAPPYAVYACPCGHLQRARGESAVTRLVTTYGDHRSACPLRVTPEGRAA